MITKPRQAAQTEGVRVSPLREVRVNNLPGEVRDKLRHRHPGGRGNNLLRPREVRVRRLRRHRAGKGRHHRLRLVGKGKRRHLLRVVNPGHHPAGPGAAKEDDN